MKPAPRVAVQRRDLLIGQRDHQLRLPCPGVVEQLCRGGEVRGSVLKRHLRIAATDSGRKVRHLAGSQRGIRGFGRRRWLRLRTLR